MALETGTVTKGQAFTNGNDLGVCSSSQYFMVLLGRMGHGQASEGAKDLWETALGLRVLVPADCVDLILTGLL